MMILLRRKMNNGMVGNGDARDDDSDLDEERDEDEEESDCNDDDNGKEALDDDYDKSFDVLENFV